MELWEAGVLEGHKQYVGGPVSIKDEVIGKNDFTQLVQKYANVQCVDPKGDKVSYKRPMTLQGILDINDDGISPATAKLYYSSSKFKEDSAWWSAAHLAYEAYFVGKDYQSNIEDWHKYYAARSVDYSVYLKERFGSMQGFDNLNWDQGGGDSTLKDNPIYKNAQRYASFAYNIDQNEGNAMTADNSKELQQEGNKVLGIRFTKFIVDKQGGEINYEYDTSKYGEEASTQQKITIQATLENGSTVTEGIKVFQGSQEIKVEDIEAGQEYALQVPGSENSKVTKVKFTSSYYLYQGRIYLIWSTDEKAQARIIVGGKRVQKQCEVEFGVGESTPPPPPDNPDTPFIDIIKLDQNGARLEGVEMSALIDGLYDTGKFITNNRKVYDRMIYLNELLGTDTKLVAELDDIELNNAGKFFDTQYQCGKNGGRVELEEVRDYVRNEVERELKIKLIASPTYQMWVADIESCESGNHHHNPQNHGTAESPSWCSGHSEACNIARAAKPAAERAVEEFASKYPANADELRDWLYARKYNTADYPITFGTSQSSVSNSELDPMPFSYTAWDFYNQLEQKYDSTVDDENFNGKKDENGKNIGGAKNILKKNIEATLLAKVKSSHTYRGWESIVKECKANKHCHEPRRDYPVFNGARYSDIYKM